jgi:hypothetical protein
VLEQRGRVGQALQSDERARAAHRVAEVLDGLEQRDLDPPACGDRARRRACGRARAWRSTRAG